MKELMAKRGKWIIAAAVAVIVVAAVSVLAVKNAQAKKEKEALLADLNASYTAFENEKDRTGKLELYHQLADASDYKESKFDEVKSLYAQKLEAQKKFFLADYKETLEKNTVEPAKEKDKKALKQYSGNLSALLKAIEEEKVDDVSGWKQIAPLVEAYDARVKEIEKAEKEAEEKKKAEEEAKKQAEEEAKRKAEEEAAKKAEEEAAKKAEEEAQAVAQLETNDNYQQETPQYQEDYNSYDDGNDYSNDEPSYDNGGSDDSGNDYNDYNESSNNYESSSNNYKDLGGSHLEDRDGNKIEGSQVYGPDLDGNMYDENGNIIWNINW